MADFLSFEKNGQTVLINLAHVVAVNYKPDKGAGKKQQVHILGQIILKNKFGDSDIFGLATIETLEFDTVDEAQDCVDNCFGHEEKKASLWEKLFHGFLIAAVVIAVIATLVLMVSSLFNPDFNILKHF